MLRYFIKRLLLIIPTFVGITLMTFFVMKLAPGDPMMLKLRFAGQNLSPQAMAAYMNQKTPPVVVPPAYVEFAKSTTQLVSVAQPVTDSAVYKTIYWIGENSIYFSKWFRQLLQLDFGLSFKDRRPVLVKICEALPVTLIINLLTIFFVYVISIPLGIWSARHSHSLKDQALMVVLFVLYALPGFWVATILLVFFAGGDYLNLFPLNGLTSDGFEQLGWFAKLADVAWHLVLPVTVETIGSFAFLTRFSRANFLDVLQQDFVRTARAKGLPESQVLTRHVLRNALIPFVSLAGTLLPALLGGSVIVEQVFSIPGMGMLSFEAVLGRDHNVIMGLAAINALLTLVSLLIADLAYGLVDPRIQLK